MTASRPRERRPRGAGSIRARGTGWQARYTRPDGTRATATLDTRTDAAAWLAEQRDAATRRPARTEQVRNAIAATLAGHDLDPADLDRAAHAALDAADRSWP